MHVLESPTGSGDPARAAFAVGKTVGGSVIRHEVVRRIRALMPPVLEALPPGTRVVVRALPEAAGESSPELQRDLTAALSRALPAFTAVPNDVERSPGTPLSSAADSGEPVAQPEPQLSGLSRVAWIIGTPLRWLLIGLVWVYRHTISPILPPTCRYHPSCSAYAFEALQVHGAAKGFVLAVWRVLRCNPFTPGGLDPVPHRGQWRPDILPDGRPRTPAAASGSTA